MRVLGIESSCDETAAAVVADGERILSNVVASQVLTHARYGGVVPELASREHLRKIIPVVEAACREAEVALPDIDALAVTEGPGLIGSLLVGVVYAKALALSLNKPLVGVNHLEGHIHAVMLENHLVARERFQPGHADGASVFPSVTLVVSGGHTSLFLVDARGFGESSAPHAVSPVFAFTRLGQTRDDAAGEAFDKVAKLLALGYPGGPIIDRLARFGKPEAVDFGRIRMKGNPLDFSFSGLKTAVLYRVRGTPLESEAAARHAWCKEAGRVTADDVRARCSQQTLDLVASFQRAVVSDLVDRTLAAADKLGSRCVFFSGGVAANSLLREMSAAEATRAGLEVFFPSLQLSTDNAAMIAAAGYFKLMAGERADSSLTAHASFPLGV
ncbi:MAG TPA: tRNA (adenosine(37)-N6)-threonylcarbamoyltransferase complex transferase subunit TsaD [Terriglobia bacterium]|nr:tRNA (adenosine(37)-N6)-threonylcarbamoyltransferase complex transferase subunit TsaD [Terriglobia bacterium]